MNAKRASGTLSLIHISEPTRRTPISYAVQSWTLEPHGPFAPRAPMVTWSEHGAPLVAAVENGPLAATQFHPEKSGDAGAHLLENWVRSL